MSVEVLDTRAFERFCRILKGKVPKHIEILSSECGVLVNQIRNHDLDAVIFNAHKLKSSTGQIGAKALSNILRDIEIQATEEKEIHCNGGVLIHRIYQLQFLITQCLFLGQIQ